MIDDSCLVKTAEIEGLPTAANVHDRVRLLHRHVPLLEVDLTPIVAIIHCKRNLPTGSIVDLLDAGHGGVSSHYLSNVDLFVFELLVSSVRALQSSSSERVSLHTRRPLVCYLFKGFFEFIYLRREWFNFRLLRLFVYVVQKRSVTFRRSL